ncbi:MAG: emp24/gp25L/p24 family protein [Bacteroidetes bacterium]|nr:emp24/gp25L/p24 family protein [Bacteroidota bacterium]
MKEIQQIILIVVVFLVPGIFFAQSPLEVVDRSFKLEKRESEVFYYGFAEGDRIDFSFEVIKGKKLSEVEVFEYDGPVRYSEFDVKKTGGKIFSIQKTGIIGFKFSNSKGERIISFTIYRTPASKSKSNFDTEVLWETKIDTTYVESFENYLVSRDTIIHNITDQVATVNSSLNLNGNKTTFNFQLPSNVISWSYYIGVNQDGKRVFEEATQKLATNAGPILNRLPGYGPLAALALGGTSYLARIQSGDDVSFYIVEGNNVNLFLTGQQFRYYKKGKVINDFSKMLSPLNGMMHFCLINDNTIRGVEVVVKVTAISVNEKWGQRVVNKRKITKSKIPFLLNEN